jgi:ATP-dependent Clp protease ATP-binding subunit ClpX
MAKGRQDGNDAGNDSATGGDGGGFRGRRVTTCSFCGKTSREVGPMVEGPNDVYICSNCVDLCQNIFKQERRRVTPDPSLFRDPGPRQIKEFLDEYVIGQVAGEAVAGGRGAHALQAAGAHRQRTTTPSSSTSPTSC